MFRTKYNVKVVATNGTYYSDYKSMPGQAGATSDAGLAMLANGKSYKLSAKMSKGYATTIISDNFKVNSLLGMWNKYGKAYDPQGLVAYAGGSEDISGASIPDQLKSNKDAILDRAKSQLTSGTPNWLGPANGSLYATGNAADMQTQNKAYFNIGAGNLVIAK